MQCGVDERHRQKKLIDLLTNKMWAGCWKVACDVVDNCGILVLLGTRGNGKTQMSVELLRRACLNYLPASETELQWQQAKIASYRRIRELHMSIREAYGPAPKCSEADSITSFVSPKLLVIDECQEITDSEWAAQTLTHIIDRRYGSMKPTVLVANATKEQFAKLTGDSITDRVKEGGGFIVFDWPSFRKGL